jgi:hypothetical protein
MQMVGVVESVNMLEQVEDRIESVRCDNHLSSSWIRSIYVLVSEPEIRFRGPRSASMGGMSMYCS